MYHCDRSLTICHELRLCQYFLQFLEVWELLNVERLATTRHLAEIMAREEDVGEDDALAGSSLRNFALPVTVECDPLDVFDRSGSVESGRVAALVLGWKTYHERADLQVGLRGIDVRLEYSRCTLIDLVVDG